MDYINLGNTGLKVSRICLGMMSYGTPAWRDWVLGEEDSRPFIQRALELGVNFFDTAWGYGSGRSEQILGRLLKRKAGRRLCMAVKKINPWAFIAFSNEDKNFTTDSSSNKISKQANCG